MLSYSIKQQEKQCHAMVRVSVDLRSPTLALGTSRPALAMARLFCGVRTWYERPCSRRVTSGASPHRWIIPGGTSRVFARSLAVDRARPRARFARRSPAWLLFTLNGRFGSDPAVRFAFVRTGARGAIQP